MNPDAMTDSSLVHVILLAALATYVTRMGGYVLINRFKNIHPRVEAALNAVPAAVMATLVFPAFFNGGWDTKMALAVSLLVTLRYPGICMLLAGWITVLTLRQLFGF